MTFPGQRLPPFGAGLARSKENGARGRVRLLRSADFARARRLLYFGRPRCIPACPSAFERLLAVGRHVRYRTAAAVTFTTVEGVLVGARCYPSDN